MSDEREEAGQPAVEMTLAQWVETLPPGHGARQELRILAKSAGVMLLQLDRLPLPLGVEEDNVEAASSARVDAVLLRVLDAAELRKQCDRYAAQLARLPHSDSPAIAGGRVSAVLKRVGDAEGALAALVDLIRDSGDPRMTIHAAYDDSRRLLERRPRGMGGTAHGVSQ